MWTFPFFIAAFCEVQLIENGDCQYSWENYRFLVGFPRLLCHSRLVRKCLKIFALIRWKLLLFRCFVRAIFLFKLTFTICESEPLKFRSFHILCSSKFHHQDYCGRYMLLHRFLGGFLVLTSSTFLKECQIKNAIISTANRVKLLGVHIDGRLDL